MRRGESAKWQARAAEEFDRHLGRHEGAQVAASLSGGLDLLRDLLYLRVHSDVERMLGVDSMLMPVSEIRTEADTKAEIELYQIAESVAAVRQFGYLGADDAWCLPWVFQLRLGDSVAEAPAMARIEQYLSQTSEVRRLAFSDVLGDVLPESRRAPLVLFRLLPPAIQIATALAFRDTERARHLRGEQADDLPAIRYCQQCHGEVLENGEQCRACGNPLWKTDWLTAVD